MYKNNENRMYIRLNIYIHKKEHLNGKSIFFIFHHRICTPVQHIVSLEIV